MLAAGADPLTIVAVVLGLLVPIVAGLIAYIFTTEINRLRAEIEGLRKEDIVDLRKELKEASRQREGIMATIGPLMWRLIGIEDWLEKHPGEPYDPPRDMGWAEQTSRRERS